MCTRQQRERTAPGDPAEAFALVVCSRRERLLGVHRHRLPRADLEDCYSQATLELLMRIKGGAVLSSSAHVANALEQRLLSRIHDRRRALCGRSPIEAAIATALPLADSDGGGVEVLDLHADVERLAMARHDLQRITCLARELTRDQRLVLLSQLWHEQDSGEFCRVHGWSAEKYRKVGQRARSRLRALLSADRPAAKPKQVVAARKLAPVTPQGAHIWLSR